jgi:hypothetical protein
MDGYKFYCSRCGWNQDIVRKELGSTIWFCSVFAALGMIGPAVIGVVYPSNWVELSRDTGPVFSAAHDSTKVVLGSVQRNSKSIRNMFQFSFRIVFTPQFPGDVWVG